MIKSHLFASKVVHPSTCFVCSLEKTAVLLFGIFFSLGCMDLHETVYLEETSK